MITSTPQTPANSATEIELKPNFRLPIAIFLGSIPLIFVNRWVGSVVGLFSVFLWVQAATIRLRFTASSLAVYRANTRIRDFPYADWQNWRIFWPHLPILFYFREVKSIHFVPVLFDPKMLQTCLKDLPQSN